MGKPSILKGREHIANRSSVGGRTAAGGASVWRKSFAKRNLRLDAGGESAFVLSVSAPGDRRHGSLQLKRPADGQTAGGDRRKIQVFLTAQGIQTVEEQFKNAQASMLYLVKTLGPEDTRRLIDLGNRVFQIMEEYYAGTHGGQPPGSEG